METFRQLIRGWFGKLLLVLVLGLLALTGLVSYDVQSSKDASLVKVNGKTISQAQLDNNINAQRERLLAQVQGDASLINDAAVRKLVLDDLVSQTLLLQQASKSGLMLSDQDVAEIIRKAPVFQIDGKFSNDALQGFLARRKQSLSQFLNDVKQDSVLQLMQNGITNTSVSSTTDVERLVQLQAEKRDVHVASLPLSAFAQGITVSNAQISDYYTKNKASMKTAENADVDYIVLDSASFASQVAVTEADIQAQYQSTAAKNAGAEERHIQHILIEVNDKTSDAAAKKQIEQIAAKVKAGEDFGALAKQFSQDAGSASQNGDLGFISKGSFPGAFDDTAFSLSVSQVSAPVKSAAGYHLIKVVDIKKPDVPALDSMRPQLEQQARQAKLDDLYNEAINGLNDLAVNSDNLADLAKAQHLSVQQAKAFTPTTQLAPLNAATVKQAIFNDDVVHGDRKISTGIQLDDTHYLWLKVANYRPVREQTLAEATPGIKQKLEGDAMLAKAQQKAKAIIDALKTKSPQVVQQENAVLFQSLGALSRGNAGAQSQDVVRAAFSAPAPAAGQWSANSVQQGDNLLIVAVSGVDLSEAATVSEQDRAQIASLLTNLRGQQELADYTQYLKSIAKIKGLEEARKIPAASSN